MLSIPNSTILDIPPMSEQASKGGSVQMSMRDGEDVKSQSQKSERSMMENGDVEEGLEFLEEEKGDEVDDPAATGNVVDDDDRQPIPEGKVIQTNINAANVKRNLSKKLYSNSLVKNSTVDTMLVR